MVAEFVKTGLFNHFRTQFHSSNQDAWYLHHQVFISFTLDAHDDTLATIVQTTFDTDGLALLQFDLFRTEERDSFFLLFCHSDEVFHSMGGNGQIFCFVRKIRFPHVYGIMGVVADVVLQLVHGPFDKHQAGHSRHQCSALLAFNGTNLVL